MHIKLEANNKDYLFSVILKDLFPTKISLQGFQLRLKVVWKLLLPAQAALSLTSFLAMVRQNLNYKQQNLKAVIPVWWNWF